AAMPIGKDAIVGVNFLLGLAQIEAHAGQPEEAGKLLRQLLTNPAGEYVSVTRLKIDPVWDPNSNNPRFQKLPSETETETVYKYQLGEGEMLWCLLLNPPVALRP